MNMNPNNSTQTQLVPGWRPSSKVPFLAGLLLLAGILVSPAANVSLKSNDALGTSSVTGSTNWSNGAVPNAGNTYYTANASGVGLLMRTPTGLGRARRASKNRSCAGQKELFAE